MSTITKPSMSERQMAARFPTDEACKIYLRDLRWPDGKTRCPRCYMPLKVYALKTRPFHWVCKACHKNGYRFSVLTGTIFENSNVPLRTWFQVIYRMTQAKKGVSAAEVHRIINPVRGKVGSYRTAWYMCHRIRAAMHGDSFPNLGGIVEVDETYVGGKEKWKHKSKRVGNRGHQGKTAVIGALSRKGNVVARVIERTDSATLSQFVRQTVADNVELVATDQNVAYQLPATMPHETVNHAKDEYVRGIVHTNNIESFWSLLKRGIVGNFHHVSEEYLPLYVDEAAFKFNHRRDPDIFRAVVAAC